LSKSIGSPPEWKIKPVAGFPWKGDTHSGISASWRMTGTAWALARVFGRLTAVFHIDRLTVERIAGIVRPFKPSEFGFAEPRKGRGTLRTGAYAGLEEMAKTLNDKGLPAKKGGTPVA